MKTMTRDPDNDYDIDDGVYFAKEDLVGERGAEMTSLQARQMVRSALDDGKFNERGKFVPTVSGFTTKPDTTLICPSIGAS